jgi:large subunit ribosomal protein L23
MKYSEDVLLRPLISEKSFDRLSDNNAYTFVVHNKSSKPEIRNAVEKLFNVRVISVNTMNKKGKKKRFGFVIGKQSDKKIAVVTLQDGDTIEEFGA